MNAKRRAFWPKRWTHSAPSWWHCKRQLKWSESELNNVMGCLGDSKPSNVWWGSLGSKGYQDKTYRKSESRPHKLGPEWTVWDEFCQHNSFQKKWKISWRFFLTTKHQLQNSRGGAMLLVSSHNRCAFQSTTSPQEGLQNPLLTDGKHIHQK